MFLLVLPLAVIYVPTTDPGLTGELTLLLASMLLGLYVFTQYLDTVEHDEAVAPDMLDPSWEWVRLFVGFVLTLAGVEGLLRAALGF